jgi:2-polyprenyl-3-methyl-5-hydroxy-6-metoxy-1,4-benzoquinol methylase
MIEPGQPDSDAYRSRIYRNYATGFMDSAGSFDATAAARWGRAYDHYLRGWLPSARAARVVDVACGGGRLLAFFKDRGYTEVAGVDVSPEQVALSRQVVADVVQEDALRFLGARHDAYDLIAGLDIVEHFRKPEVLVFLDACCAALRPGGRLILQTPNADSPWGTTHIYNDFTHEVGFNPNALRRLLTLAGLTDIEVRETGPVPIGYSARSTGRAIAWQMIRLMLKCWNVVETGTPGDGVFTRVFLISGVKRAALPQVQRCP